MSEKVHWLPVPLNEGGQKTACGIDVFDRPLLEWRGAQTEVDCLSCLRAVAALPVQPQED